MRYDSLTIQTSGFFDVLVNEQILICEFTNHQSAGNRSTSRVRLPASGGNSTKKASAKMRRIVLLWRIIWKEH